MSHETYGVSRFRKAIVHFIGGRLVQASARAILLLVLVRLLDVEDYGAYMLLVGLSEMMLQVASFGILPVGQRFLPQMITSLPGGKLFRFVSTLIVLQITLLSMVTVAVWYFWPVITPRMGFTPEQVAATHNAVWLFFWVPVFRYGTEMLDALLEQGRSQSARALMPTGRVLVIGILLLLGVEITLENIILLDIGVTILCVLLSWYLLMQSLKKLYSKEADGSIPYKDIFRHARHMAVVDFMGSTASPGAIRLALANALGVAESGLFAFLQSLQRLVSRYLPGTLLRGIIRPVLLARAYAPGGMRVVEAGTGLLMKSNLLIVSGGTIVIAVAGNELVEWISGGKFPHAGFTLLLMFMALAVTSQRSIIEMVMQITGHTATLRTTALIAPVALFMVWYYAEYGLNVAVLIIAAATSLSNWIAMAVLIRSAQGFRVDWFGMLAAVLPTVIAIIIGILLKEFLNPVANILVVLCAFAVMLWVSKPFDQSERTIVERAAGRKVARVMGVFTART